MHKLRVAAIALAGTVALVAAGTIGAAIAAGSNENSRPSPRGGDVHTVADAPNARLVLFADGTEKIRYKGVQGAVTNPATGVYCVKPKAATDIKVGKAVPIVTAEWGESAGNALAAFWNQERGTCPAGTFEIRTFAGDVATNDMGYTVYVP